ncbi:hypothetical protein [Limihaloglobus sulfuriphilus]|uniref:hypothetical protein n=1 Tax=Limihaloglobus sulfuriphilus TaxID=1851148 RepID=UPI001C998077|nr:hypothetical protein [Limihaloglobus sulfuriphilus]
MAEDVFSGRAELKFSDNDYDWLGNGIYFWENNPVRALEFAKQVKLFPQISRGKVKKAAVVGAIIDLGHCLNLLDSKFIEFLKFGYEVVAENIKQYDEPMPENTPVKRDGDLLIRRLDCAVVEAVHEKQDWLVEKGKADYKFDTTRGVFIEGKEIYPNSGFRDKNHIQICVRNPACIKGYFRVRSE